VRIGIGLAIATGAVAVVLALKHLRQVRREHAARLLTLTKDHGSALSAERTRNAEVVQVLTDRVQAATDRSAKQQIRIGELNTRVTELTGDNARLRSELKSRDVTIAGLRETVRSRDTEIQLLRADLDLEAVDAPVGEVQQLPRHLRGEQAEEPASELWTDADHPTVVDMRPVEAPLPNYEVDLDRKHA
jgi:chromosome segregation ATPase